ncbi:hypothetical protein L1049_010928 [Liquidambar formosana]|uniref:NB-ARC domain-containing protein n=1 Tax=Liquidambar formosana TaxID=63359 RepID=A0AAP0RQS0_LIQFO
MASFVIVSVKIEFGKKLCDWSMWLVEDPNYEIDLTEIIGQRPMVCPALQRKDVEVLPLTITMARRNPMEIGKRYTFDISKVSDIFDHLLAGKYLRVLEGHKVPTNEAEHYCKWHGVKSHTTNNCVVFWNLVQDGINRGMLKFPKRKMIWEADKEEITKLLLSDDASDNSTCVVTIVGLGGVGKTTLAQLLYNDEKVNEYFDLKAWVCVSKEFDVLRETKTILESVNSQAHANDDLNLLQVKLKESLMGKKFLIVLDDIWNDNYDDWDKLRTPFGVGDEGSKIIVTTRHESVESIMHTIPTHHLKQISDAASWSLFEKHAFEGMLHLCTRLRSLKIDSCPRLKSFSRGGLPTTLKTLSIGGCEKLELDLPKAKETPNYYASLESLSLSSSCDSLKSFPLGLFPKLNYLYVWDCKNLDSLCISEEGIHDYLTSLNNLNIHSCPKFVSFPKGGLPTANLTSFFVFNCKNLKSLPENMHTLLPSLQELKIRLCP